ncbi:MAG: hypothetical protein JXB49_05130 [Bacteroidales bacterium]|nr:hypothetical protein [Bacteroidales bacterium]
MKKMKILIIIAAFAAGFVCKAQNSLTGKTFTFETKDTVFKNPYVDIDEWRDKPFRFRYVHGGFKGTDTRFSFYFPSNETYEGRFFQYVTPFPDNENIAMSMAEMTGEESMIGFSVTHGAYFIETNGGGKTDFTNTDLSDGTIGAYRANAASADFSRMVAQELFGGNRPYGYLFGGSGGAYRTVGGIENTEGVWDGAVPYVMGSPMAIPNCFTIRMHAMRILNDKFPQILDAIEPGGSGDMYAGLNQEEKEALQEVTRMGFPPKAWYAWQTMGIHGFLVLYSSVVMIDRNYFTEDFWNKPGYLGYNPPKSLLNARIQKVSKIKAAIGYDEAVKSGLCNPASPEDRGSADKAWKNTGDQGEKPEAYWLEDIMPDVNFLGGDLIIKTGAAAGSSLQITKVSGDKVALAPTNPLDILAKIKPGDEVQVDNSNFLAVQTYHRHQVPDKSYYVYDQFRDKDGNPLYPQRPMLLGPMFAMGAAGSVPTGKFKGKMILLGSLWDSEAFPWQSDWYRQRVIENLKDQTDDNFRLWYMDNAAHSYLVHVKNEGLFFLYMGILQQSLLDLSLWVEKGIPPAASTNYKIEEGQVIVPETADERAGIQPVVNITINGKKRADISVGQTVTFKAVIEIPKDKGILVSAAWDFDNSETYKDVLDLKNAKVKNNGAHVEIVTKHKFNDKGTFFPMLLVASERNGDKNALNTKVANLDRVKVVVK